MLYSFAILLIITTFCTLLKKQILVFQPHIVLPNPILSLHVPKKNLICVNSFPTNEEILTELTLMKLSPIL